MAIISDPARKESLEENMAIELLGRLRYRPALDLLTERFLKIEPEADYLFEDFEEAMPRIGDMDLIAPMEKHFRELPWELQISVAEFCARINHPASEAAVLRMIDVPDIDEAHDHLLQALTKVCTTDGLPKLRESVLNNDYNARNFDIKEEFESLPLPPRPAPVQTIVNKTPKVGRNDPCPSGSGKKYKKCCLNK